ncbi:MAG: extracellular solute-binding protein [Tabrizicola sp.]|nr:extracellular solute-binding protein [Tabrizicola sp.]
MTVISRRRTLGLLGVAAFPMPFVRRAHAEEPVIHIYNWADYIGETTLADFTAETGIEVVYDLMSSNEEAEAKLLTGQSGYDLVLLTGSSLPRLVPAGTVQPIDRKALPLWGNLDPEILRLGASWDPGNAHGFPYTWGTAGITYNADLVKERLPDADLTSLDLILKPENAEKLADCGITLLDTPEAVLGMTMAHLGLDPAALTAENIDAAVAAILAVRSSIQTFDNTNFLNTLPTSEVCVANTFAGDYAAALGRAMEAGIEVNLGSFSPRTGAPIWVAHFCIPSDAAHVGNAHVFLNYLLRPEVIASTSNYTYYANANLASRAFVAPEILADPAIYPDAELMARLYAQPTPTDDQMRLITDAWRKIRNG